MVLVDLWASPATFTSGWGVPLCLLGRPKSWAKLEKGFLGFGVSETAPSQILLFTFTRQHFPWGAKQTLVKNLTWDLPRGAQCVSTGEQGSGGPCPHGSTWALKAAVGLLENRKQILTGPAVIIEIQ